jgi:hypothetical protein
VAYRVTRTLATVACCVCGAPIAANPLTMCAPCIATNGNVAKALPRRSELHNCRNCDRYQLPRKLWVAADWESRELMTVCLKKLKGLSKLKLVDAQFIWTEPHSKRERTASSPPLLRCSPRSPVRLTQLAVVAAARRRGEGQADGPGRRLQRHGARASGCHRVRHHQRPGKSGLRAQSSRALSRFAAACAVL